MRNRAVTPRSRALPSAVAMAARAKSIPVAFKSEVGCHEDVLPGPAAHVYDTAAEHARPGELHERRLGSANVPWGCGRVHGIEVFRASRSQRTGQPIGALRLCHGRCVYHSRRLSRQDVLVLPQLAHYVDGWKRPSDLGVVADVREASIGTAWLRLFPADDPGHGFINERIPELSIGVVEDWRGRGVGGSLLTALTHQAQLAGFTAISLSVEIANPAVALYERHGFRSVGIATGAYTMRRDLAS